MTAEFEKVVSNSNPLDTQQPLPERADFLFDFVSRRYIAPLGASARGGCALNGLMNTRGIVQLHGDGTAARKLHSVRSCTRAVLRLVRAVRCNRLARSNTLRV